MEISTFRARAMTRPEQQTESIFWAALAIELPEARARHLDEVCGGDEALRARVEELLAAYPKVQQFLEAPAGDPDSTAEEPSRGDGPGSVIGPYKLLEMIGEGGMGTVYMAEQTRPMSRKVALKIIKPGMDSRQVVARFEAERQALALMDHPNIARVLDGGTTPSGRPYFAMELVKGVPLTEFCDENRLTARQRLELFVPVCQAVQHAHQKGIIHRDLKPSNVLVTVHDTTPVVKVIDFGVAKALGQELTEKTLFTGFAQMIGTPLYMSPEQAGQSGLDVDTRSDIYSLGVLLYELLTGTTPFNKGRFERAAYDEILRIIREEDPPKPSTRLTDSKDSLPSISARRNTEPARLTRLVRGDLDWIVMKCLEKDRSRRYETANGLALEVEKYLHDEPVTAGPPSATYRFRKFVRRNRSVFLMVILVALTLVAGALGSMWQAVRATHAETLARNRLASESLAHAKADSARAEAEVQRELARGNLRKARRAVDDMYTAVAEKWLAQQPQMEPVQRDFLEKALRFYQEFAQQGDGTEPEVRLETAIAYRRVADIQFRLGATAQAEPAFREATTRLRALVADFPAAPEYRAALADSLHRLGILYSDIDRNEDEEKTHREALGLQERLVADFPTDTRYQRDLARGQYYLGAVLARLGRLRDAEEAFGASIARQEKLADGPSSLPEDREYLADSLRARGRTRTLIYVRSEPALADLRRSIELFERLVDEFPNLPQYRNELADTYFKMFNGGHSLTTTEVELTLKKALDIQRKLAADYPRVMYYRYDLVRSLSALARRLKASRRTSEAIDTLREALVNAQKLEAESSPSAFVQGIAGTTTVDLVRVLTDAGQVSEADELKRRLIERSTAPESLNRIAWYLVSGQTVKESDSALAVALARKAVGLAPQLAKVHNTLGVACYRAGDWKGAIAALTRAEELAPGRSLGHNAFFLAMAHWQLGDKGVAREFYDRGVAWMNDKSPYNAELLRFRAEAEALFGIKARVDGNSDPSDPPGKPVRPTDRRPD
jgi:serine/threonine protein kinase/tetratricopeptide (TPR) repeat protein